MTDLLQQGRAGLPQPRSLFFRATADGGRAAQLRTNAALGLAGLALVASAGLGVGFVHNARLAEEQAATALRIERANADLQTELARVRDRLGAANQSLNLTQGKIAALASDAEKQIAASEQAASSKTDRVAQLGHALEQAQRELHLTEAQRVTLLARLSKAEADLAQGQSKRQQVEAGADEWQRKVQQLTADRDRAAAERDQLRARLAELEQRLPQQQTRPAPRPQAAAAPPPAAVQATPTPPQPQAQAQAAPPPAAAAAAPAAAPRVAGIMGAPPATAPAAATVAVGHGSLAQFERVLASAGVDVAHLFAQYGMRTGEGGPFVPAPRGAQPEAGLTPQKLAALSRLIHVLPVAAPLGHYEVGSPFGVRHDPINGRSSYHTGIDLLAQYMSPVYATAPGVVTYSGYRDDYGKVVEIDHGNGISTRYAHLHRALVSVGQRVEGHTEIGLLGSTGRATGPHVHYEVLVNGEPQDPAKFFGLAHLAAMTQH